LDVKNSIIEDHIVGSAGHDFTDLHASNGGSPQVSGDRQVVDPCPIQPDFSSARSAVDHDMEFQRMPATAYRCRAGQGCSIHIIPQAEFAGCTDEEISDRPVCRGSVAEKIDLAGIRDQVEINTPIALIVGGRECLLGVGIAIGGVALGCIGAAMNESCLNGKPCAGSPGR
jgi:hypothetical protein